LAKAKTKDLPLKQNKNTWEGIENRSKIFSLNLGLVPHPTTPKYNPLILISKPHYMYKKTKWKDLSKCKRESVLCVCVVRFFFGGIGV
jgi:hypothetical protein